MMTASKDLTLVNILEVMVASIFIPMGPLMMIAAVLGGLLNPDFFGGVNATFQILLFGFGVIAIICWRCDDVRQNLLGHMESAVISMNFFVIHMVLGGIAASWIADDWGIHFNLAWMFFGAFSSTMLGMLCWKFPRLRATLAEAMANNSRHDGSN